LAAPKSPLVSIVMPVRNAATTLRTCLRSLELQTMGDWELLVMDDGSRDESAAVAASLGDHRIRVFSDSRWQGISRRLNQALPLCRGRFFARMDADDVAYPARLEKQVSLLEQRGEIDLVGTGMLVFGEDGSPLGQQTVPESHDVICSRPYAGFPLAHPTFLCRVEWIRRFRYDGRMRRSQDQDLLLRSYRFSRFGNLPEILLGYREQGLSVRKQLKWRLPMARALGREFLRQGRPLLAGFAVAGQAAKASVDIASIASGLGYRILRHRARPIGSEDAKRWSSVWRSVQDEDSVQRLRGTPRDTGQGHLREG
jgi:glycosyltransferase involved in cell wall biosynthesis